jgi:hypothetical protein
MDRGCRRPRAVGRFEIQRVTIGGLLLPGTADEALPMTNETFIPDRRYAGMTQADIWYVAFRPDKPVKADASGAVRTTRTFKSEIDAKLFAMQILAKGWTASAGTLGPDQPKRIVGASEIERWADPGLGG